MNLKHLFLLSFMTLNVFMYSQTANNYAVTQTQLAQSTDVVRTGYNTTGTSGYISANSYNLYFGKISATATGTIPTLKSFQYNSNSYIPFTKSASVPYNRIVINRKIDAATTAQNINKFTGFFEYSLLNGNSTYFKAEYVENLESLINSYVINRGVDNIFSNNPTGTTNNVERIDLILNEGVVVPSNVSLDKLGTMLLERGGNDNYKIAVITSLDAGGKVLTLGNLVSRSQSNFSSTGYTLTSTVFQNSNSANASASENLIKPSENIGSQAISGDFITFSQLGVTSGQIIYGISVLPGDVVQGTHDVINLTNVPTNTDGTVDGGLDFMGGGGFFVAADVAAATVSGNIFRDIDGNTTINGNGIGMLSDSQLYAYLVAPDNSIIAKVAVAANGSYTFPSTILDTTNTFTVAIDTRNITGTYNFATSQLPAGWEIVGEDYGINNNSGSGVETGFPNFRIAVQFDSENPVVSNVNFGILSPEDICTVPVDGNTFQWNFANSSEPFITENITQPPSNYGFVFDIYELDNSFNLNINGTLIATQELQFQSNGTSGINLQFADGDRYEINTTHEGSTADIWQMRGNAANPLIRISISRSGQISLFGSKASYGPLYPLVLTNGNALNSIMWNQQGTNNITVTQNVVGVTIMDGYGYGLNLTPCACYNPATITGNGPDTRLGITLLQRAGSDSSANWPMVRKSGHIALESNTKGFVVTRLSTVEIEGQTSPTIINPKITNPQEGMLIYDTTAKCLKIYSDNKWSCFTTPACP